MVYHWISYELIYDLIKMKRFWLICYFIIKSILSIHPVKYRICFPALKIINWQQNVQISELTNWDLNLNILCCKPMESKNSTFWALDTGANDKTVQKTRAKDISGSDSIHFIWMFVLVDNASFYKIDKRMWLSTVLFQLGWNWTPTNQGWLSILLFPLNSCQDWFHWHAYHIFQTLLNSHYWIHNGAYVFPLYLVSHKLSQSASTIRREYMHKRQDA